MSEITKFKQKNKHEVTKSPANKQGFYTGLEAPYKDASLEN